MTKLAKAASLMVLYEVLIATTPVVYKTFDPNISAALFVGVRFGLVALVVGLIVWFSPKLKQSLKQLSQKQIVSLVGLGLTTSGLASWLYFLSVKQIGAALSSIVTNLELVFGIGLASFFLKEKLSPLYLKIGSVVGLGLVLILIKNDIQVGGLGNYWLGLGMAFIVALVWGSATVVGKVLLKQKIEPLVLVLFRYGFGSLFNLSLALIKKVNWIEQMSWFSGLDWLKLGYLVLGPSLVGFYCYYQALKLVEVKKLSLFNPLMPVVASALAVMTGEKLGWNQWLGGVLIILGIFQLLKKQEKI